MYTLRTTVLLVSIHPPDVCTRAHVKTDHNKIVHSSPSDWERAVEVGGILNWWQSSLGLGDGYYMFNFICYLWILMHIKHVYWCFMYSFYIFHTKSFTEMLMSFFFSKGYLIKFWWNCYSCLLLTEILSKALTMTNTSKKTEGKLLLKEKNVPIA